MRADPQPAQPPLSLAEHRAARDRAREEYLAATRRIPRDTTERASLWRTFVEANAAHARAGRGTR